MTENKSYYLQPERQIMNGKRKEKKGISALPGFPAGCKMSG